MIHNVFFNALLIGAAWCAWQISVADMRRRIIPDAYLFPLLLTGLLILAFYGDRWVCGIGDAAIGGAFGYALGVTVGAIFDYIMRRRDPDATTPIGFGDIKLMAVGGIWIGVTGLAWAMIAACLFGAAWARVRRQRFIPFAPFFIMGTLLTLIAMMFLI